MIDQLKMIHTSNCWMHFIGGLYTNTDKFINEAISSRISRRAPAQIVRGMQFGDRLILLRYQNKTEVFAFAEAQIIGITLDHEIASAVGEKLKADGKAEYHEPSGGSAQEIQRECGSYMLCGSWTVTASLSDVIAMAMEIAKEKDMGPLFVMVNAELKQIYGSPVYLDPAPKFTRGFIKVDSQSQYYVTPQPMTTDSQIFVIRNYMKRERKPRRSSMPALPMPS